VEPVNGRDVPVTGLSAMAYDALGDGRENDRLAVHAVDGVVDGEVWRSECYAGTFAVVGKKGVGLMVQADRVLTMTRLELFTTHGGWQADVYASDRPASDLRTAPLEAWGTPVAGLDGATARLAVELPPTRARTLMVFFTSIADVPPDDCFGERPGSRRIEVAEARLFAAP
jgi:hypothetical protein